jgi:hypothetical protein
MPSNAIPNVPMPPALQGLPAVEAYPCVGNPQRRTLYADTDCWIDPTNGSDGNRGTTLATAIRTWEEARRRYLDAFDLNCIVPNRVLTFHIVGTIPALEGFLYLGPVPATAARVVVQGENLTTKTSTLSAVTAKNPATNAFLLLTDAAAPFTAADVLAPVLFTTGPAAGALAWVESHAAGVLTMSSPATAPNSFGTVLTASPAIGNGYQLFSSPSVGQYGLVAVGGDDFGLQAPLVVKRLRITGSSEGLAPPTFFKVVFQECRFDGWLAEGSYSFLNCCYTNQFFCGGGRVVCLTGLWKDMARNLTSVGAGCVVQLGTEPMLSGCGEMFRGRNGTLDFLDSVCLRNCVAPIAGCASRVLLIDSIGPASRIWGSGQTDCTMKFYSGSQSAFGTVNTLLTAVGGGGGFADIKLGDGTRATARPTDPATGLPVAVAIATSFVNWVAAPVAGFGRNLCDTINAISIGSPGGSI